MVETTTAAGNVINLASGGPHKWPDRQRRQQLPIDGALAEILAATKRHQVIILEGETGSGKTTRLSQAAVLANPTLRVWHTQTRRNAVRWNGRRIASEMGEQPGETVGWRLAGEEPVTSDATRLMLCIDQSLSNRIREFDGALPRGLLVIDEAHERHIQTDILLGLIKEGLATSPETRVVVTSATLDVAKFSAFFDGAPIYKVPGRCFPVDRQVVTLERAEPHTAGACRLVEDVLSKFVEDKLLIPTEDGKGKQSVLSGTVVMLLPGKEDIRSAESTVRRWMDAHKEDASRIQFCQCHGELGADEQDAVQAAVPMGHLRVVAGTEILRSSVTVPQTVVVIDALRVKRMFVDDKGVSHLQTIAVSAAEAKQAEGRAGRTNPGLYIAVSEGSEFHSLRPDPMPEILQAPLTSAVLQVASIGKNARTFSFIDAPPTDQLEVAFKRLTRLGALDKEESITELGKTLLSFPVDPERAMMLVTAMKLGVLAETVVLAGTLESGDFFFRPNKEEKIEVDEIHFRRVLAHCEKGSYGGWRKRETPLALSEVKLDELPPWAETLANGLLKLDPNQHDFPDREGARWIADLQRKSWADGQGDLVAIVIAYRAFKAEERRLRDNPVFEEVFVKGQGKVRRKVDSHRLLEAWCRRNFLHHKRLRMAENTMQLILDEVRASSPLKLDFPAGKQRQFSGEALTKAFLAGHPDHVGRRDYGRSYKGPVGEFELAFQSSCPSSELVVVSGVHKIPVRGRRMSFVNIADTAAPVKPEWFREAAPQLCSVTRQGDYCYDEQSDTVVETEVYQFGDFELGREQKKALDPVKAADTFAAWISGRYFKHDFARHNRTILEEAERLNAQAGQEVFLSMSQAEYATWLKERLNGATSLAEVRDFEVLRLPTFDSELVQLVKSENPDKIKLGEAEVSVSYSPGRAPQIQLDGKNHELLRALPETEIRLAGGRAVAVSVSFGYWDSTSYTTDTAALRNEVRQRQAKKAFDEWQQPSLEAPTGLEAEGAVVPQAREERIGTAFDGTPLVAHGALRHEYYYGFGWKWFRTREEAEQARATAVAKAEELQAETRRKREHEEARLREEQELASLLALVKEAFPNCPLSGDEIDWTLDAVKQLKGYGRDLDRDFIVESGQQVRNAVDHRKGFPESCKRKEAQVVRTYFIGDDGAVDALAFDKYGDWQLALRYRKRRADEVPPPEASSETTPLSRLDIGSLFGGNVTVLPTRKKRR